MERRRIGVVLALLGLVAGACRSSQGPAVRTQAAPPPDFLQSYTGQMRILVRQGDAKAVSVRKGAAAPAGTCNVAVRVRKAAFEKSVFTLWLETVGRPTMTARPSRGPKCGPLPHERMLSLSGLEAPTASDVAASLDGILPTPEAYLAAEGIPFDLPPGPDPGTAASREASASPEERTLARRVTTWPRDLLAVEPLYFDPSGKVRHEAEVAFVGVVGTDGRLHQARLLTPLDKVHEEAVLLALNLWRFEAALRGDEHVAARVELRTTFRIY